MTEPAASPFLPFALPEIGDDEIAAIIDTVEDCATGCSFSANLTDTTCERGLMRGRMDGLAAITRAKRRHDAGREASLTAVRGQLAR